jgi:polar amino acid transport system substrate-binding protein
MPRRSSIMTAAQVLIAMTVLLGAAPARSESILSQVQSRGTLRIAVIGGMAPYSRLTPSGEPEGYDIDIARGIAAALKVKPEFIVTDIPGRVTALQTHKADLTIADFTRTVERSTTIGFTDPYLVTFLQFMTKAGRDELKTIDDINHPTIKIAISRGGTAERTVPAIAPTATLVRFNGQADELNALQSGQVDVMAEDGLYDARALGDHPGEFKILPGQYARAEICIGLPAGDFDWWRLVNLWVEQFNASGDNAVSFKKWFGQDMPQIQRAY